MLVIENCNSLSELRQKLIDGEEVRTARQEPCDDVPDTNVGDMISRQAVLDLMRSLTRWCVRSENGKFNNVGLLYDDVMFGIDKLPPVNPQPKTGHWIPVSERLPDKEGYYLCSVRYMYPPYNFFEPEKVKYMDDVTIQKFDGEFNIEVKAWMPLPEPYEAESEDK